MFSIPKMFGFGKSKSWSPDPSWATGGASSVLNLLKRNGVSYKDSVWIVGGIERTGRALGSLPMQFINKYSGVMLDTQKPKSEMTPWLDLFSNPNPLLTFTQIIEMTAMQYSVYGSAFWIKRTADYQFIQAPLEIPAVLDVALPGQIEPRFADAYKTRVVGWTYIGADGSRTSLQFFQVVRFYRTNPESAMFGLSIYTKIASTISLESSIKHAHRELFENGGRSHGWFSAEKRIDEPAIKTFKKDYEEKFTGSSNYGKAFLTPDGITYNPDKDSRDMDYKELSKLNRDEEFGATGVPKHHMGVTDNLNFATAEITDKAYWINEIIPLKRSFEDSINSQLMLGSGINIKFDTKDVPVIANATIDLLDKKLRVATRMYRLGQPLNQIALILELPVEQLKEKWANAAHDPLLEIGKEKPTINDNGTDTGKGLEGPTPDPFVEAFKGFSFLEGSIAEKQIVATTTSEEPKDDWDLAYAGDFDAMERVIKQIEEDTILPLVPGMTKTMESYFNRLGKSQITRLQAFFSGGEFHGKAEETTGTARSLTASDITLVLFDPVKWDDILKTDTLYYHKRAYSASIKHVESELGSLNLFQQNDATAAARLQEINAPIVGINARLRERLRQRMAVLVDVGVSSPAIIQAVQQEISVELSRASMIARTETGMAASRARWDVMSVESPTKRWLSAKDGAVRTTHRHYNSLGSKPMNYEYAHNLHYPLEQGADAGEIINCRCVLVSGNRVTKKP